VGAAALKFFVLACLAGFPLALSHDVGGPLALVAFVPLFWLARHGERVFWLGALAGFTEVFIAMWGCSSYGYIIPLILALQGAVVRGLACWLLRHRGVLAGLSMVVVGQWIRTLPPLSIPISVGHDLVAWPSLAQPAALGGGALLVWICALSSYAVVDRFVRPRLLLLLVLIYSVSGLYAAWVPPRGEATAVRISAIQGGLPNWVYAQSWIDPKARQLIRRRYLAVAEAEAERGAELVILPESAVREDWPGQNPMAQTYREIHDRGVGLIAGINSRRDGEWRNSALAWPAKQAEPITVEKRIIVPIVERAFRAGDSEPQLLPFKKLALALCIESIYPEIFASMPKARWGLVITNDAGVGSATPRRAFERETRLRALEQGLPILRVAQDGRSYLVAANGAIVDELPEHQPGVLRLTSLPARRWTLYGQLGNWLAWLSLVILVLRLRRRPSGHEPTPASA